MKEGKTGDRLVLESERTGRSGREGVILEVLRSPAGTHYRVRWSDGHESTFFPAGGGIRILEAAGTER